MMSRYFRLKSETIGVFAKRLHHVEDQLPAPGSYFNQFITLDIYT